MSAHFTQTQLDSAGQYFLQLINRGRANPTAEAGNFGIDLNEELTPGTISLSPKQPLAPSPALLGVVNSHLAVWLQVYDQTQADIHDGLGDGTEWSRILGAGFGQYDYYYAGNKEPHVGRLS